MNRYLFSIVLFLIVACIDKKKEHQIKAKITDLIDIGHSDYTLIRDDLYSDANRNLYLKSLNNEDVENTYYVWINDVFCDTCFVRTENGIDSSTELKDLVDVKTFHFDSTDEIRGGTIYADKNYSYYHKWMADGGTIILMEKR